MSASCACGRCAACRHRAANRAWYAKRRQPAVSQRKAAQNLKWDKIYEVKFTDPAYYAPRYPTPGSSFNLVVDWLIGRGEARHTPRAPGCD